MKVRALVVDDEPLARRRIMRLLRADEDVEVVGNCATGAEAMALIRDRSPDLVFLDVVMPAMDGFALLDAIEPDVAPAVVFVTACGAHAIRAFDVNAVDYLLKPVSAERLEAALHRARERMAAGSARRRDRLLVKSGRGYIFVKLSDVDWVQAEGNNLRLHAGGQSHLIRESMRGLEGQLDPTRFLRIHRSTLVNLDRVREVVQWFAGEFLVRLHDGTELKVSRGYRRRLTALM